MLHLTRLGGPVFALNPDLIERAEATPDTVITLVGGNKYVVCESLDELSALIRAYRAEVIAQAHTLGAPAEPLRPSRSAEPRHHAGVSAVVPLHPREG